MTHHTIYSHSVFARDGEKIANELGPPCTTPPVWVLDGQPITLQDILSQSDIDSPSTTLTN